ncbi:MAG: PQQ-binding-like beta-propeller repeat protein [Acidobacteriota bacterium]
MYLRLIAVLLATVLVGLPAPSTAETTDWPQYRGPNRDGLSTETGLLTQWGAEGPAVAWRTKLGGGYSGLAVADGKIFTLYSDDRREWLGAFSATDGKALWQVDLDKEFTNQFGNGPRSTPLIADGVVYTVSSLGALTARKTTDGSEIWTRNLKRLYGAGIPTWGISASPILIDGKLILDVGGSKGRGTVAFDATTGKEAWTANTGIAGYSAPIEVTIAGQRQVISFAGKQVVGLNPTDGDVLWTHAWRTDYDVNAATPIFVGPDKVFIASGYNVGGALLHIEKAGNAWNVDEVWKTSRMQNQFSSAVLVDGTIYGFDNKFLRAADLASGEILWSARGFGHGSLMWADGHLIILGDKGDLAIAKATPEGYEEVAKAKPLSGKHWTVPTLHDGRLLVRNEQELVAFELRSK